MYTQQHVAALSPPISRPRTYRGHLDKESRCLGICKLPVLLRVGTAMFVSFHGHLHVGFPQARLSGLRLGFHNRNSRFLDLPTVMSDVPGLYEGNSPWCFPHCRNENSIVGRGVLRPLVYHLRVGPEAASLAVGSRHAHSLLASASRLSLRVALITFMMPCACTLQSINGQSRDALDIVTGEVSNPSVCSSTAA